MQQQLVHRARSVWMMCARNTINNTSADAKRRRRATTMTTPVQWQGKWTGIENPKYERSAWLDCDPGHDDAMACILAWRAGRKLRMIGASTCAANVELNKTSENFQRVMSLLGEDVRCVPGAARPLLRPHVGCPEIHGDDGLGGARWPQTEPLAPDTSVPAIVKMAEKIEIEYERINGQAPIALICTGALTNAALLLSVFPEIAEKIEIVFMGGAVPSAVMATEAGGGISCTNEVAAAGNTGVAAEFNIQMDPEAAKIVMDSPVTKTMIPLQITHSAILTEEVEKRLTRSIKDGGIGGGNGRTKTTTTSRYRDCIAGLLAFFRHTYKETFGFHDGAPLHDPCAVAFVLEPTIFTLKHLYIDVETTSTLTAGQTVADVHGILGKPPNCFVAVKMDVPAFWNLMVDAVDRGEEKSPW